MVLLVLRLARQVASFSPFLGMQALPAPAGSYPILGSWAASARLLVYGKQIGQVSRRSFPFRRADTNRQINGRRRQTESSLARTTPSPCPSMCTQQLAAAAGVDPGRPARAENPARHPPPPGLVSGSRCVCCCPMLRLEGQATTHHSPSRSIPLRPCPPPPLLLNVSARAHRHTDPWLQRRLLGPSANNPTGLACADAIASSL